ncbi:MAG: PIN domain-containing protein [Nanoarchaeota archaeon]|nr:PIN domain-containing protein [Nanoarchaeota archaeon]
MNIIIDSNIFISALIKDSTTRKLITNYKYNFLLPEYGLEEILSNKDEILKKSKLSEKDFYILLLRILKYIQIIPSDLIIKFWKQADEIIGDIDKGDSAFVATALAFDCPIWSDDKHFQAQDEIIIYTTRDMI